MDRELMFSVVIVFVLCGLIYSNYILININLGMNQLLIDSTNCSSELHNNKPGSLIHNITNNFTIVNLPN